jgi:Flp pilus assembly protein TadD
MPSIWASEAEKQTLLLAADTNDKDAMRWLAMSLFMQFENGEIRTRDKKRHDKNKDYWAWMSHQPIGQILEIAQEANPESIDLKIALLSAYVEHQELFDVSLDNQARRQFLEKANRTIDALQLHEDGKAQWACITFSKKISTQQADNLLTTVSASAVDRLRTTTKSTNAEFKKSLQSSTPFWDMTIAMARAKQLDSAGKNSEADSLYRELMEVDKRKVPDTQRAELFLQFGRSLWQRKQHESALDVLRTGSKDINHGSALELWELIAVIECEQSDLERADRSIADLERAVKQAREYYLSSPIRDAFRERELQRLAQVRWHATLLKSSQSLKIDPSWEAISELVELLQSQQDISAELRWQANLLLANAYATLGFWDMEARTLEEALNLTPDDKAIRKRVADAWLKGGILTRAESQLKLADDGSFALSLQQLQVMIETQRVTPPASRKVDRLRQLQNQTRRRLLEEKNAGKTHDNAWVLEMIELSHVIDTLESNNLELGVLAEQGLAQLVQAHPDNVELQALAAKSFTMLGDEDRAATALSHLDRLKQQSPKAWFETLLQVQLHKEQFAKATELVQRTCDENILPELMLRRIASKAFSDFGAFDDACRILLVRKECNDVSYLFSLASSLLQVTLVEPDGSGEDISRTEFVSALQDVATRIRTLEGPRGTLSQFLDAAMLLRSAQGDNRGKDLERATKLIKRVVDSRPRWMEGLKLAGDLRAAAGDAEEAVSFYRRAIAEGDTRIVTVFQLAQQLSLLGRLSEAEFEFQRIAHLSHASRAISEFAIGLELQKGNDTQALELARALTSRYPKNVSAWLMRAQAVMQRDGQSGEQGKENLLGEAEECYRQANELSKGSDLSVWIAQLRFTFRFLGPEATNSLIDKLRGSPLSEKSKALLIAQALVGLHDYTKAIDSLHIASKTLPFDIDILCAMGDVYRLNGQTTQALETLDKAYRLNPKRTDVARSLAMMLATSTAPGSPVPWERIRSIAEGLGAQSADAKKLFFAFLLVTRGSTQQHAQALSMLNELVLSNERPVVEDALRLSITIHRQAWEEARKEKKNEKMQIEQREIQRLFDTLWRTPERATLVNDLYQHADLLLQVGELSRVSELIDDFDALAANSPLLLNLRFQLAVAQGKESQLAEKMRQWVGREGIRPNAALLAEAGRLLSEQGMSSDALPYLKSAYELDSQWLRPLVVGLSRAERLSEALQLCTERYRVEPTIETVSLLTDLAILSVGRSVLDPRVDQMIQESLLRFPSSHKLLELAGTLRLFQHRYIEAVELLARAEKLAPSSVVTLNNFAIAASEIPGREREGLARIEKAIELYGRTPDLLDTLGTVQLACGQPEKAEESLMSSWEQHPDSRTLLHLLQSMHAQKKESEIREKMGLFRRKDLQGVVLTPREQQALEMLRQFSDSAKASEDSS